MLPTTAYWYKIAYKNPFCLKFWQRKYALFMEKRQGVDFSVMVDPEDVGLSHTRVRRSCPTAGNWLRRALKRLPICPCDSIIDIGCGKGAAMRILLDFPFSRVDGVEIADPIAAVARENFKTLGVPEERCRVYTKDAAEFCDLDAYNHIYFYNPFPPDVMSRCLANICNSLDRRPRKMTLIYNHPSCHEALLACGRFAKFGEYDSEWGNKIYVYRN